MVKLSSSLFLGTLLTTVLGVTALSQKLFYTFVNEVTWVNIFIKNTPRCKTRIIPRCKTRKLVQ